MLKKIYNSVLALSFLILCIGMVSFFPLNSEAMGYHVDATQSSLAFSGAHADAPFQGVFDKWEAVIEFDPTDLAHSSIEVIVDMRSARTGNPVYDGTLPTFDWLNIKNFAQAQFKTDRIEGKSKGTYVAIGTLTLRDKTLPLEIPFQISTSDSSSAEITATANVTIDRLAYDIGKESDPEAKWVSREITLDVKIWAKPIPVLN